MNNLIEPGDIIVAAYENFRKHFRLFLAYAGCALIVSSLSWTFLYLVRNFVIDKSWRTATTEALLLPSIIGAIIISIAVIHSTAKTLKGESTTVKDGLMAGFHYLLPWLWVMFLVSASVGLGFGLLLFPGILLLVWFKFAQFHLIVDGVRGTKALKESRALVVGRWWSTCFRLVVPFLFFVLVARFSQAFIYLMLGVVSGDPGRFFSIPTDLTSFSALETFVLALVDSIITSLSLPLFIGSILILWFDLKSHKAA